MNYLLKFSWFASTLFFVGVSLANAQVSEPSDERLASLLEQTFPVGVVFQRYLDKDPSWPLLALAASHPPEKLACMREQLSTKGTKTLRLQQVRDFQKRNPDIVEPSIKILESGAAEMMGAFVLAGADAAVSGNKPDMNALIARYSPLQTMALMEFLQDYRNKELRELAGIGDSLSLTKSREQNKQSGEATGALMSAKLLLLAMDKCNVPMGIPQQ